jgi:hypothetical protein
MRYYTYLYTLLILCCLTFSSYAQGRESAREKETKKGQGLRIFLHPQKFYRKYLPTIKIKKPDLDTHYVQTYPNYLKIGVHVIAPTIRINLYPDATGIKSETVNASNFRTNIGNIIAFTASYRFITAGFAVVLSTNSKVKDHYVNTAYRTATIAYNSTAYSLQFKYIRTKGFTDINGSNRTNPFEEHTKRGDLIVKEFQFEGIYNFSWKKYSFYAPIDYTQRQLKSRIGLLVKAGIYYNDFAADTNLLSIKQRPFFEDFEKIKAIQSTSFKLAPGLGVNLVFLKRFYLAGSIFLPYNLFIYKYISEDDVTYKRGESITVVLDAKVILGYQSKRFYAGIRYEINSNKAHFKTAGLNSYYSSVSIDLGYRFTTPRIVKKIYKLTMPPGM